MKLSDSIDKYKVYELLGRGGFAEVYRAVELETGTEVAIKKISKQSVTERNMWDRVKQELAIHSVLEHPSIVKVFTCFQDINYIYLVLEFCSNGELRKLLEERNLPFNENQARGVLRQVLSALKYLHSHRIIHRDLTLSNILLTREWGIKIADFGLAVKFSQPDEKHKTMCGTPNYIAPEVVTRKNQGPETDIWNIGILFYTLLVGKPPFDTENGGIKTTLHKVVTEEIIWPSTLSSEAVNLMDLMLKKDSSERITLGEILKHPFMVQCTTDQDLRMLTPASSRLYEDSGFVSSTCLTAGGCSGTSTPFNCRHANGHLSSTINSCNSVNSNSRFKPLRPFNSSSQPSLACSHSSNHCIQCSHVENCTCCVLARLSFSGNSNHLNNSTQYQNFRSCSSNHQTNTEEEEEPERVKVPSSTLPPSTKAFPVTVRTLPPGLSVPLLNTTRLKPKLRMKGKMVYFSILNTGEVCLEFFKEKHYFNSNKFVEIMLISSDGWKISLQHPYEEHSTKPGNGVTFASYNYGDLPEKFLKKYFYALKCVNNEKAVTSKIIYYGPLGKCHLMENGPDPNFTVHFHSGEKIIKKGEAVEILDKNCKVISTHPTYFDGGTLRPSLKSLWNHFKIYWEECLIREKDLDELSVRRKEIIWFPNTSGQKPSANLQEESVRFYDDKENLSQKQLPLMTLTRKASASAPSSLVGRSLKSNFKHKIVKTATVQGIGTAFQMLNGLVCVNYLDKTKLEVQPSIDQKATLFTFTDINDHVTKYRVEENVKGYSIPEKIREKISLYGVLVEKLKTS